MSRRSTRRVTTRHRSGSTATIARKATRSRLLKTTIVRSLSHATRRRPAYRSVRLSETHRRPSAIAGATGCPRVASDTRASTRLRSHRNNARERSRAASTSSSTGSRSGINGATVTLLDPPQAAPRLSPEQATRAGTEHESIKAMYRRARTPGSRCGRPLPRRSASTTTARSYSPGLSTRRTRTSTSATTRRRPDHRSSSSRRIDCKNNSGASFGPAAEGTRGRCDLYPRSGLPVAVRSADSGDGERRLRHLQLQHLGPLGLEHQLVDRTGVGRPDSAGNRTITVTLNDSFGDPPAVANFPIFINTAMNITTNATLPGAFRARPTPAPL